MTVVVVVASRLARTARSALDIGVALVAGRAAADGAVTGHHALGAGAALARALAHPAPAHLRVSTLGGGRARTPRAGGRTGCGRSGAFRRTGRGRTWTSRGNRNQRTRSGAHRDLGRRANGTDRDDGPAGGPAGLRGPVGAARDHRSDRCAGGAWLSLGRLSCTRRSGGSTGLTSDLTRDRGSRSGRYTGRGRDPALGYGGRGDTGAGWDGDRGCHAGPGAGCAAACCAASGRRYAAFVRDRDMVLEPGRW